MGKNGDGILQFGLAKRMYVTAKLIDIRGKLARTLIDEMRDVGYYSLRSDGLSKGSYIMDFKADDFHKSMRFIKR